MTLMFSLARYGPKFQAGRFNPYMITFSVLRLPCGGASSARPVAGRHAAARRTRIVVPLGDPTRSCSQTSGLGAHQFHRPNTCINAGTSTIRTRVASTSTATVRPSPNIRMTCTWAAISAANEIDMIRAAAVITRPVRATPGPHSRCCRRGSPRRQPVFADARDQEHLVVHRQPERDAEHQDRHLRRQRPGEVVEPPQMAVLEDPHHRTERRGQPQHVEHQRLDRHHHAPGIRNSSTNVITAIQPHTSGSATLMALTLS